MPQAYLRTADLSKSNLTASPQMFNTGPFDFADLASMDSNTISPLNLSSASSTRTASLVDIDACQCPALRSTYGLPLLSEKMCPLISGETDVCEPVRCGPNAPCMNFTSLAPIEECGSVPCINHSTEDFSSASPPQLNVQRSSLRLRRPMTISKRSQTPLSTSSGEDRKTNVRRPTVQRTISAPDKPLSRVEKKQRAKQAHSLVEKKYRENLNTKLQTLHTTLQATQYGPNRFSDALSNDSDIEICDDDYTEDIKPRLAKSNNDIAAGGSKFRKSEVLDDAMNYVNQTEVEMRHMEAELIRLTEKTDALEKALAKRGKCEDCSVLKRMVDLQVQAAG